ADSPARRQPGPRSARTGDMTRLLALGLLALSLAGCSGRFETALDALREGRLPAAASELRLLEPGLCELPPRERARYALYRGLAELGLGNASVAGPWLASAWLADRGDPTC